MDEEKYFGLTIESVEDSRIQEITEAWFIKEPALMMGLLSHRLKTNSRIKNFRCGKGIVEYNPEYTVFLTKPQLEERLKAEVIRILLRHPYRNYSDKGNAFIASNITLNENYTFIELMFRSTDFWMEPEYQNQHFEFYYRELNKLPFPENPVPEQESNQDGSIAQQEEIEHPNDNIKNTEEEIESKTLSKTEASEAIESAELWEEDDFMEQKIKEIVEWAHTSMLWGTLPGNLVQTLIASLKPEIDYRKVLSGFRASVISSDKMLTRFRPSRRYGFLYMGKKSEFTTHLLIAVDVSGSVSDKELQVFYSVILRFFKYGIRSLDVLQFDAEIKEPLLTMQKAKKSIAIQGRGGTDFQPVIDYFENARRRYDGLIIFTDGYAPEPKMLPRSIRKTLWICSNRENYDSHEEWMRKCGRCCWVEI